MNTANLISKKTLREKYEAYNPYFNYIMSEIVKILQSNVSLMAQPTYKSRVKSFDSYYKKILRLKPETVQEEKTLICLTDMMGIRMICAFLEDINIAVEQLKKIFDIKEVEIKGSNNNFKEFGYESVHVLIKIPNEIKTKVEKKFKGLDNLDDELVCEIQIRTILQDAWAEVEHELIYKTEFNPFDIPLRRKLASINASLTLADITFQEIRDYQNKLQKELDERRRSFYNMADGLLNEKPAEEGSEDISRVSPYVQGTIDELLLRAIEAHNQGHLSEAVDIYTRIIEAVPDSEKNIISIIRKHRGMAFFAMNNLESAIEDFQKSIEADPKAFRSYYYKGIVYSIQKKYQEAVECYSKSLKLNEFQAHTNFRRAMAYYELGEYEKSMNDLDVALKLGMNPQECKPLQDKLVKKFHMNM